MNHPTLVIGRTYFVDNPSAKSYVGRLVAIIDPFTVALEEASWVANTGRFHRFMAGELDNNCEIEPCANPKNPKGFAPAVRYQSINEWPFPLPINPKPE